MTMDTSHLDDDALSASLDGELAHDAGQGHLAGCATCTARRDQLAAARSALAGAPVEPVDELTRRRLIAAAVTEAGPAAARPRPWYQRPALAGGVAAAILALFAAVPFVTGGRSSTGDQESATAALDAAAGEFLGDLGDLSDPSALRGRFASQRSLALSEEAAKTAGGEGGTDAGAGTVAGPEAVSSSPVAASPAAAPVAPPQPADSSAQTYGDDLGDAATNRDEAGGGLDRAVADACARTLAEEEARGNTLRAVATGTYRGTPAVVAVFEGENGIIAYVASRDGCRLLTQYPV
ncbi:MAG: hypothetical protein ACRD0C_07400 [Acidimicrobiia bacterium]